VIWLYYRFALSIRDVEELPFERGIVVTYEIIHASVQKFGARFAAELRRREKRSGRTWHLDDLFVRTQGQQVYLWRAVDEQGQVLDILVQERCNTAAVERFFHRPLDHQLGEAPEQIVTDKLASCAAAKEGIPALSKTEHLK
jgi:putative transposase